MHLAVIAGARPNFMKVAPLLRAARSRDVVAHLVHTGQHYDEAMSATFFADLGIPEPDANLGVGSGSHGEQTAKVMARFEGWLSSNPVDAVVVVGDVNSTVACALVASKAGVPVAHVEAGLRSFDRTMPEELNRVVVDGLSTWLLTPSADADANLAHEGAHPSRVRRVGNIMVDSLMAGLERADGRATLQRLGVGLDYGLVTLHRPALVDDPIRLEAVLLELARLSDELQLVFAVHPRTRQRIAALDLSLPPSLVVSDPLRYLDFIGLEARASLVLTDSGGVQEETTCLGVPCLTLRDSTERPITVTDGTNRVIGTDPKAIVPAARDALADRWTPRRPELWDGKTAERVLDELEVPVDPEAWAPYGVWARTPAGATASGA